MAVFNLFISLFLILTLFSFSCSLNSSKTIKKNTLPSPGGLIFPHECIHQVASGTQIKHGENQTLFISQDQGRTWKLIPKCNTKPTHGSAWKTWAQYRNPSLITQLNGIWNTPPLPSRTNSQILYFWNGVEPNDNTAVLQPVLQYGSTPAGGGNYWGIASWYVSEHHGMIVTKLATCKPGDPILGQLTYSSNGTWVTNATNLNTQQSVYFVYTPQEQYDYAYEVLEAYFVTDICDLYPPTGVVHFHNISVQVAGKTVTPQWQPDSINNQCNEHTKVVSSQAVDILFNTN